MKLNNSKQIKNKFNPIGHWYMVIFTFFILTVIIVIYSVYSFFYIKKEISLIDIEARNSIQNSTSTYSLEKSLNDTKFLKDINNLNKVLEEFKQKEVEYNRLIKSPISVSILKTTTSSTTVATSTE